jgi:hypothetical protein
MLFAVPVGRLPTGAGRLPALPILQTHSRGPIGIRIKMKMKSRIMKTRLAV